jgi:hypothetical protein
MEIVLNARVVPVELRGVVQAVVRRFTFGPQSFLWVPAPTGNVVLVLPPVIVESLHSPRADAGAMLREGIEDEIQSVIEDHRQSAGPSVAEGRV